MKNSKIKSGIIAVSSFISLVLADRTFAQMPPGYCDPGPCKIASVSTLLRIVGWVIIPIFSSLFVFSVCYFGLKHLLKLKSKNVIAISIVLAVLLNPFLWIICFNIIGNI